MRLLVLLLAVVLSVGAADSRKKNRKGPEQPKTENLTGCLDQRGESYYLAGQAMQQEARLRGKAFSDDNFARYVGHKVTVQGTVDRSSGTDVFDVVKIDDVSESCR